MEPTLETPPRTPGQLPELHPARAYHTRSDIRTAQTERWQQRAIDITRRVAPTPDLLPPSDPRSPENEQTALQAYQTLKNPPADAPPEALQDAANTLRTYRDTRARYNLPLFPEHHQAAQRQRNQHLENLILGDTEALFGEDQASLERFHKLAQFSGNPEQYEASQRLRSFLTSIAGHPLPEGAYEGYRAAYASQHLGLEGDAVNDDHAVFTALQSRYTEDQQANEQLSDIGKAAYYATFSPEDPAAPDARAIIDALPERHQAAARSHLAQSTLEMRRLRRRLTPIADEVEKLIREAPDTVTTTLARGGDHIAQYLNLAASILPDDPHERQLVHQMLMERFADVSESAPRDGMNVASRALEGIISGHRNAARAFNDAALMYDAAVSGRNEQHVHREKLRELEQLASGSLQPLSSLEHDGFFKRGIVDFSQSSWTFTMFGAAGLAGGAASRGLIASGANLTRGTTTAMQAATVTTGATAMAPSLSGLRYIEARSENPEAIPSIQAEMAVIGGTAEAFMTSAVTGMGLQFLRRGVPSLYGILNKYGVNSRLARGAIGGATATAIQTGAEYTEEFAQETTNRFLQDIALELSEIEPTTKWDEWFKDWATFGGGDLESEQMVIVGAVLPFALIAGAGASFNHFKYGSYLRKNKAVLRKLGIPEPVIQTIATTPDIAKADEAFRTAAKTELGKLQADQKKEIHDLLRQQLALAAAAGRPQITEEYNTATESVEYTFHDPVTRETTTFPNEEAALDHWRDANLRHVENDIETIHRAAHEQTIEHHQQEGQLAETTNVTRQDVSMTPQQAIERNIITRDQLNARIEAFLLKEGLQPGTPEAQAAISELTFKARQFTEHARDGSVRYIVELYRGANPLDLLEDIAESNTMRMLNDGFIAGNALLEDIRAYEAATGHMLIDPTYTEYRPDLPLPLLEGMARLARGYVIGQANPSAIPESLGNYIDLNIQITAANQREATQLADDLGSAAQVREAVRTGQISPRLQSIIEDAIGINEPARIDRLTRRMEAELAAEAMGGFPEIRDEAAGQLPHPDTLRKNNHPLYGEVRRIWDEMVKPTRRKNKRGDTINRTNEANAYFLPIGQMADLDEVRQRLNQRGFDFSTPADLLDALAGSILYNTPTHATNSILDDGQASFALSPIDPTQPGGAGNRSDAAPPSSPVTIGQKLQQLQFAWKSAQSLAEAEMEEVFNRFGFSPHDFKKHPLHNSEVEKVISLIDSVRYAETWDDTNLSKEDQDFLVRWGPVAFNHPYVFVPDNITEEHNLGGRYQDDHSWHAQHIEELESIHELYETANQSNAPQEFAANYMKLWMERASRYLGKPIPKSIIGKDGTISVKAMQSELEVIESLIEELTETENQLREFFSDFQTWRFLVQQLEPDNFNDYLVTVELAPTREALDAGMPYGNLNKARYVVSDTNGKNLSGFDLALIFWKRYKTASIEAGKAYAKITAQAKPTLESIEDINKRKMLPDGMKLETEKKPQPGADMWNKDSLINGFALYNKHGRKIEVYQVATHEEAMQKALSDYGKIPLDQPFNQSPPAQSGGASFALSPSGIVRLEAAIARKLNAEPLERAEFYQRIRDRIAGLTQRLEDLDNGIGPFARKESDDPVIIERRRIQDAIAEARAIVNALPPEVRGKVPFDFAAITNATTERGRVNTLVKLIEQADQALEPYLRQNYHEAFTRLLDLAKPDVRQNNTIRSRLTPATQRLVNQIAAAAELTPAQALSAQQAAQAALDNVETREIPPGDQDAQTTWENDLADAQTQLDIVETFGTLATRTATELAHALETLETIYTTGRTQRRIIEDARRQELREARAQLIHELGEPSQAQWAARTGRQSYKQTVKDWLVGYMNDHSSFHQIIEWFFPESTWARDIQARVRAADRGFTQAIIDAEQQFYEFMRTEFGFTGPRARHRWNKMLFEMSQRSDTWGIELREGTSFETVKLSEEQAAGILDGTFNPGTEWQSSPIAIESLRQALYEFRMQRASARAREERFSKRTIRFQALKARGNPGPLNMSQLEALYILQLSKQDQYLPALDRYGFTREVLTQLEAKLDDRAAAIGNYLARQYAKEYDRLNPVFQRLYGMDMPQIKNYAPGHFEHFATGDRTDVNLPEQSQQQVNGMSAGFTKIRTNHLARPQQDNALSVYWSHLHGTEYFIHFAELLRDMSAVLKSPDVRRAIEGRHGTTAAHQINQWIKQLEHDGNVRAEQAASLARISSNLVATQSAVGLAANIGTLAKQSSAMLGSLSEMPVKAFLKGIHQFTTNPDSFKKVWASPSMQQRLLKGVNPEDRRLLRSTAFSPSLTLEALNLARRPIAYADSLFTTIAGTVAYAHTYQAAIDSGMSPKAAETAALDHADRVITRFGQPATTQDKSLSELTATGIGKFLFLFKSDVRQKLANALQTIALTLRGDMAKTEAARRFLINWIIYGMWEMMMIDLIRSVIRDDDDPDAWSPRNYAAAALAGPVTGIGVVGSAIGSAIFGVVGTGSFPNSMNPLDSTINRVASKGLNVRLWKHFTGDEAADPYRFFQALAADGSALAYGAAAIGFKQPAIVPVAARVGRDAVGLTRNIRSLVIDPTPEDIARNVLSDHRTTRAEERAERNEMLDAALTRYTTLIQNNPELAQQYLETLEPADRRLILDRARRSDMTTTERQLASIAATRRQAVIDEIVENLHPEDREPYLQRLQALDLIPQAAE